MPEVKIIAYTVLEDFPEDWKHNYEEVAFYDVDILAEIAGRNCYQSWDRPNPGTKSNRAYVKNIIDQGHMSVLEHSSATFYITGVSTALLGQITRHRHLSFSVESARYVDKSLTDFIEPNVYQVLSGEAKLSVADAIVSANEAYNRVALELRGKGLKKKEASQAARFILPQGISTKIVVTGNMRAWREFLQKRLSPGADVEIREVANLILEQLKDIAPSTFQDM